MAHPQQLPVPAQQGRHAAQQQERRHAAAQRRQPVHEPGGELALGQSERRLRRRVQPPQ